MNTANNWIQEEELPIRAGLVAIRENNPNYGLTEEEIQDRNEFIRCYLFKDFELLMIIPNQTPGTDFFIQDCDVFESEYTAFNTHDFQNQMRPFNKYGYAMKKIMENVKNMAIMHSCCTYPKQRQNVYRKYEAFVNGRFRNRLLSLTKQYKKVDFQDRQHFLKQKIAKLNQRILECKRIWERYAPAENWDR
jgi:hypothetical protein